MSESINAPICSGTGLLALDVLMTEDLNSDMRFWAGGSFGNVMSILAYFGWSSFPIARLGNDMSADYVLRDLENIGVQLDLVERDPRVNTPVIVEHLGRDDTGRPKHRFLRKCPTCGAFLPRYRPALTKNLYKYEETLSSSRVFYFDRASPIAIEAARLARSQGALVVFEPSSLREDRLSQRAVEQCHLLKYSHERVKTTFDYLDKCGPSLIVETLGESGLRYRLRISERELSDWTHVEPFPVQNLADTAGAGDWCTAGIILQLSSMSMEVLSILSPERIQEAMRFGQAIASINCEFEGARGAMFHLSSVELMEKASGAVGDLPRDTHFQLVHSSLENLSQLCSACP